MEPIEGFHIFTRLIPDLQRYTAQGNLQILPLLSQTSTRYRSVLESSYKTLCEQKPITKGEANRYVNAVLAVPSGKLTYAISRTGNIDSNFGAEHFIVTSLNLDYVFGNKNMDRSKIYARRAVIADSFDIASQNSEKLEPLMTASYVFSTTGYVTKTAITNRWFGINSKFAIELGLSDQLNVFARREQCQRLDPQFANKRIIAALQYLLTSSDNGNFTAVLCVAARLDIELRILEIFYPWAIDGFRDAIFTNAGIVQGTGEDYRTIFRKDNQNAVAILMEYYAKATPR